MKAVKGFKPVKSHAVPSGMYEEVVMRDGGCVARSVVREVQCWGRIDPHHVQPRGRGGADTADNLISLCRAHHDWVHAHPHQSTLLGFLRGTKEH